MTDWVSLHAFHGGDLDALLVHAVAPELETLHSTGALDRWFFLRYWEGGTHLRLRLYPTAGAREIVTNEMTRALERHLTEHPSPTHPTGAEYPALAAMLARQEGRTDYERELRRADSVAEVEYVPETDVYGDGDALEATEKHFWESSQLALQLIRTTAEASQRRSIARLLLLHCLATVEPDPDRLAVGFAAGADMAMRRYAAFPNAGQLAADYDERRDHVVREIAEVFTGERHHDAVAHRWRESVEQLATAQRAQVSQPVDAGTLIRSPLAWHAFAVPSSQRHTAGVLFRCAHLISNRLGIPMADELSNGYVVARAFTDRALAAAKN